jgi:pimeloyl-ACP methyl ester carboxylesterase
VKRPSSWLVLGASLLIIVPLGALGVLWLGASASLDRGYHHSAATRALPLTLPTPQNLLRIPAGQHTFRARMAGAGGSRGNIILLHGFAESSATWTPVMAATAAAGYQVVAFDQRGYSPGARPRGANQYGLELLARDVRAVARAMDFDSFHLIGQGWGARVGWRALLSDVRGIVTWTALSMPHPGALAEALRTDPEQRRRNRYLRLLRTPWLAEQILAFNRFEILRETWWAGHSAAHIDEYLAILSEPGALTAANDWFRAPVPALPAQQTAPAVPALLVWGNRDPFLSASAIRAHRRIVGNRRTSELELTTGHKPLQSHPELVTSAILKHLSADGG